MLKPQARSGYSTSTTDPETALERVRAGAVDCVVSDYRMPGTDGLALLDAVREASPELPFILYTGEGSESVASEAISKGVTEYLRKETGTSQYAVLANRIENAVERHRASTQVERGFRAIETAREGISILDESGHFVYVNDAYTDVVGYDRWTGETVYVRGDGERVLVDHVATMDATVDRLEGLVDDMASVMREGDIAADRAAVDVASAAREAWEALDATDATLVVEETAQVRADEGALTRLFDNLLGNALEHAGPDVTVRIGTLPAGFYVADDGPGVPPGDRETVFEPGYSLAEDGTGFGLASVRQIALAHGWDVSVTESEAGGARFEVTDVTVLE